MINELEVDKPSKGKYILVRTLCPGVKEIKQQCSSHLSL